MLKKSLALITVFALVFSMAACGSSAKAYNYDLSKYITLGDYMGIEVVKKAPEAVTSEDVDAEIKSTLEANATTEKVDRAAKDGDTVNITYEGTVEGKKVDACCAENQDLILGSGQFIDGFESGLVGKKAGDKASLDLKFPDDYQSEDVAGKDVTFKVTVNTVSEEVVPELTDKWVKESSNSGCEKIDDFKAYVKKNLEAEAATAAENEMMSGAWQTVVESTEVLDYPEKEVEEAKTYLQDYYQSYAEAYGMELKDFLQMAGMDEETFQTEMDTQAKDQVAQEMIIYAIARAEGLELTDDEYKEAAQGYVDSMGLESIEALEEQYGHKTIEVSVLQGKVMDFIIDNAKIVDESKAADTKDADAKKADAKDADAKKADAKDADAKDADAKKADAEKAE